MTMKATWKGEDGAEDSIRMHGITFEAGKAVTVPEAVGVGLLGNPFFTVEGASSDEDDDAQPRNKGGRPRKPKTPDEYQTYASDWLGKADSAESIEARWKSEGDLRESVGWTAEDQADFQPAYDARLAELKPKPPEVKIPGSESKPPATA